MTKYILTPYLADNMPRGWGNQTALDLLVDADGLYECVSAKMEAESAEHALSILFREANIGERGWAVEYREQRNRSLSVGDVVAVREADAPEHEQGQFYVCAPTGWTKVGFDDIYELLTAHCTWYEEIKRRRDEQEVSA